MPRVYEIVCVAMTMYMTQALNPKSTVHVPVLTVFYVRDRNQECRISNQSTLECVWHVYDQVPMSLKNLSLLGQSRGVTCKSARLWVRW